MARSLLKMLAFLLLIVAVYQPADAQVSITANRVCFGTATAISNQSSIPATEYVDWDLNDDGFFNDASGNTVNYTFPSADTFFIRLRITDSSGTVYYSNPYPVIVDPIPAVDFSVFGTCLGSPTIFTNRSSITDGTALSYQWDFTNSGTTNSTDTNTSHTYPAAGPETIKLSATSLQHCSSSITHTITITAPPVAAFRFDSACTGSPVLFVNTSSFPGSPLSQTVWNFGDSTLNFSGDSVYHTYLKGDSFFVKLKVIDTSGCVDSITRLDVLQSSVAFSDSLTNGSQFYVGESTTAIITGGFDSIFWYDSTTVATKVLSAAGYYTFTVTNNIGCTAQGGITITTSTAPTGIAQANDFLTPNGDGKNDVLYFKNMEVYTGCDLKVYDERGLLVHSDPDYQNNWNGGGANAGPYYYYLKCNGTNEVKGVTNIVH